MDRIEELENKALALVQEIAELKKGQKNGESSDWKPQHGDTFYYMDAGGEVNSTTNVNWEIDKLILKTMPVFKTREECQKYCDYRKALSEKSYKFSDEEWENDSIPKYFLYYSYNSFDWYIETNVCRKALGVVHFKTQEDAEYMIDNYSEEMLKWGF